MNINLTCPINTLGFGLYGLGILRGLRQIGVKVAWWPIGVTEFDHEHLVSVSEAANGRLRPDFEAPSVRFYHPFDMAQHVGNGWKVGYTMWETQTVTEQEMYQLESLDILLVPSAWAKDAILAQGYKGTVRVVPGNVDADIFSPAGQGDPFSVGYKAETSKDTVFLSVGKWERRKGMDVILPAFEQAFRQDDRVRLVMHCYNPVVPGGQQQSDTYNRGWENYYLTSPLASKITVHKHRLATSRDVAVMMNSVDCGVFPSRGEGWNMELLEMMACGKQVITTDWSAHTAYATPENSLLIPITETEPADDGVWFHGDRQWGALGQEQVKLLAELMRYVHDHKQKHGPTVNTAGLRTARRLSPANTARKLVDAVSGISGSDDSDNND